MLICLCNYVVTPMGNMPFVYPVDFQQMMLNVVLNDPAIKFLWYDWLKFSQTLLISAQMKL